MKRHATQGLYVLIPLRNQLQWPSDGNYINSCSEISSCKTDLTVSGLDQMCHLWKTAIKKSN